MVVYDLKTGKQGLTPNRIQEIQSNLPKGYRDIPIIEIRPGATPVGTPDGPPSDGLLDIGLPDEGIPDFPMVDGVIHVILVNH